MKEEFGSILSLREFLPLVSSQSVIDQFRGPVDTPMLDRLRTDGGTAERPVTNTYKTLPLQRLGTSEDMAKTICFALSDDSSFTTGAAFSVDGGVMC